ncbi:MAG: NADH-quinone oxidoreductase subunit N [Thermoplasmata archaeon]
MFEYIYYIPEILTIVAAILSLLFDALKERLLAGWTSIILLSFSLLVVVGWLKIVPSLFPLPSLGGNGIFLFTTLGMIFQVIFLLVAIVVELSSLDFDFGGIFYALVDLALVGMLMVAISGEMVTLIISLELASISTYVLAGYARRSSMSLEAAMKYYIIGSLSSALTIFGLSIVYGISNTTSLWILNFEYGSNSSLISNPLLLLGFSFIIVGLGFKIAMVPFHMWAPDVYQGAPSQISALLASGSKSMGFMAMIAIFFASIFFLGAKLSFLFGILAVLTMTVGNIMALKQRNIKRMLAYSSVANAGYILLAFSIDTPLGLAGGMFQIFSHAVMKAGAFLVVAAVASYGIGESIEDYRGLVKVDPLIAVSLTILLLSLAGVPPLMGFDSKFVLFSSAIQEGGWYILLAVLGVINSAMSLYYYARVIKLMFSNTNEKPKNIKKYPYFTVFAIVILVSMVILIGVYPSPMINLLLTAAKNYMTWI